VSNDCSVEEPDVCVIELGGTIGDLESGASLTPSAVPATAEPFIRDILQCLLCFHDII
jgi:hypothetical protein